MSFLTSDVVVVQIEIADDILGIFESEQNDINQKNQPQNQAERVSEHTEVLSDLDTSCFDVQILEDVVVSPQKSDPHEVLL